MSELCLSSTAKTKFFSLLISGFIFLSSFVFSHPLYFLYFIFFLPFLLKVLSFLSPLFITTSLLLIAFLTISPGLIKDNFSTESSKRKVSFLLTAYHAVLEKFQPKIDNEDEEFHSLEALEVYKTVFDTSMVDERGNPVDVLEEHPEEKILQAVESSVMKIPHYDQDGSITIHEALTSTWEEDSANYDHKPDTIKTVMQEKRFEDFLQELDEFQSMNCNVEVKKVNPPGTKVNKAFDKQNEESLVMNGSEATTGNKISHATVKVGNDVDIRREYTSKIKAHSQRLSTKTNVDYTDNDGEYTSKDGSSRSMEYDLGRYGSMRKEKEWKRTLAGKLFEERHNNVEGSEGMDLLWETYEMESTKGNGKTGMKKKDSKSKGKIEYYADKEDDEEEEEDIHGQLCCLQAFKFSAGKMNMGVGRRNLVKFSKAVKGFGWLHHVSRQRKKVHNGDTFQFA